MGNSTLVEQIFAMKKKGWEIMWVLAAFDLPVRTKKQRLLYSRFRKKLLNEGFVQFQFSLYLKHFSTLATAKASVQKLGKQVPQNGKVCFFYITDKQYGISENFYGKYKKDDELPTQYDQGVLFFDFEEDEGNEEENDSTEESTDDTTETPQDAVSLDDIAVQSVISPSENIAPAKSKKKRQARKTNPDQQVFLFDDD